MQAVLLVGFQEHEVQVFRGIMLDMEADMVKVSQIVSPEVVIEPSCVCSSLHGMLQIIVCDKTMFRKTLREAMESPGYMNSQVKPAAYTHIITLHCSY